MNDSDKTTRDIEGKNLFVSWKTNVTPVTFVSHFTKYFAIFEEKIEIWINKIYNFTFICICSCNFYGSGRSKHERR